MLSLAAKSLEVYVSGCDHLVLVIDQGAQRMNRLRAHATGSTLPVALEPLGSPGSGVANEGREVLEASKAAGVTIKACFTPRDNP